MLPQIDCSLQEARARTEDDLLIVTTGRVERVWQWTDAGFATVKVAHVPSGRAWESETPGCDWQLPDCGEPSDATLENLSACVQDDEGFTDEHVCVTAEIDYPASGLTLKLTIWAYPNASGIRTQLAAVRAADAPVPGRHAMQGRPPEARVDRLPVRVRTQTGVPVGDSPLRRRFFGYYNETQQRNDTHQDILKEEVIKHPLMGREWCDWASVACIEGDVGGLALVKESHKCVNQMGHATGGFVCDEREGLSCTGWGLRRDELSSDQYTPGWATWCIVWSGGDLDREIAFKTFDRRRYPIDPERDIYIQSNTWGSTTNGNDARRAACQESVLRELEVCADMGIDVLQIDDGWQVPPGNDTWKPGENGWHPHPEGYPEGWGPVRARAEELGLRLGLWAAAMPVGLDELKANFDEGGFCQYKLDFASLRSRADIDTLIKKVREFIMLTGHKVRVNWDVTENAARYGYFFAREYGCIYLENRKPERPLSVVYRPHTVLRDVWQIAKYLNLHRFQCSVQNVDRVTEERSDARLHSHSYATAIALMGIPLFFQETKYYSAEARAEIGALLKVYREHRESIYKGIVHPIGAKPDNGSWTGFQCHLSDENRGYLTIFRERCNPEREQPIKLGWLGGGAIEVTDLVRGETREKPVGADGSVSFDIEHAPGFLFLKYSAKTAKELTR